MFYRPIKDDVEDAILNAAAQLLAQRGVPQTTLQAIADSVGYSKAGLLHHFPSKNAVVAATVTRCVEAARSVRRTAEAFPPGPARDRVAITALLDLAVRGPGFVALVLAGAARHSDDEIAQLLEPIGGDLSAAFALVPGGEDFARTVAVTGALGALAVMALAISSPEVTSWGVPPAVHREQLLNVCMGALGRT